jgi:hypothetical protein
MTCIANEMAVNTPGLALEEAVTKLALHLLWLTRVKKFFAAQSASALIFHGLAIHIPMFARI